MATHSDRRLYRWLLSQAQPCWALLLGHFLLSLLATPIALLTPVPLKIAVDTVLGSRPLPGWLDTLIPDSLARSDTKLAMLAASLFIAVALLDQLQRLATSVAGTYVG